MKNKFNLYDFLIRYSLIIIFLIGNMFLLRIWITPLTIYSSYFLFSLFYPLATLSSNIIQINNYSISLIAPCIAISAYYLLIVLNLATPMPLNKRIKVFIFSILTLFIVNVLRIVILSILSISNQKMFDLTHMAFWYFLSTLFLIIIWFSAVKLFNIKDIPGYNDILTIKKFIK